MDRTAPGRVLVTGGSGFIGTALRRGLPTLGWQVRSLDRHPPERVVAGEEVVVGDTVDPDVVGPAARDATAVVHLAGVAGEAPLETVVHDHVLGTARVLAAAHAAGVRRFVYASSNHAVGFTPRSDRLPGDVPHRPDSLYGVGKVGAEGLCSLYADRFGMECVALRIGTCREAPVTRRHLSTWLSPDDCVRLVQAALTGPVTGFLPVWGISANTRAWWDLGTARALGYEPEDDAEAYAAAVEETPATEQDARDGTVVGGDFAVRGEPLPTEPGR